MQRLTLIASALAAAKAVTIHEVAGTASTPAQGDDSCWVRALEVANGCPAGFEPDPILGVCYEQMPDHACLGSLCIQEDCPSGYHDFGDILNLFTSPIPGLELSNFQPACFNQDQPYPASIKSCGWFCWRYRNCRSGYERRPQGGWCIPDHDGDCPDGMNGDGNVCMKNLDVTREVRPKLCPQGAVNRLGVCVTECPTGTALCGVEGIDDSGLICLDNSIDCQQYIQDTAEYVVGWTTAIAS